MRAMIETEQRLECAADRLTDRARHGLPAAMIRGAITAAGSKRLILGPEQEAALRHITGERDLAIVVGYAGTGKSAMLGVAREGWERGGYHVVGPALAGIAAANPARGSGIAARTLPRQEPKWEQRAQQIHEN